MIPLAIFLWWLSGFLICAWSFDWDIKGYWLTCAGIGITGPLCFFEACSIKDKTKK